MKIHALHREENSVPLLQSPKCKRRKPSEKLLGINISGKKNHNRRANMATSWRQRNLRSRWRVRQYKDGDVRTSRTASSPSANELAWFYKVFIRHTQRTFPKRLSYAALSEPMKENHQHICLELFQLVFSCKWCACESLWCFYQLFALAFWWPPFTAEDPLVSKGCNAKFLQIFYDEDIFLPDGQRVSKLSANSHFWMNYYFKGNFSWITFSLVPFWYLPFLVKFILALAISCSSHQVQDTDACI